MKFCPNCGHECGETKKFCHECGEKLTPDTYTAQETNYTYQGAEQYSYNTINTTPIPTVSKKKSIVSFILALANTEICALSFLLPLSYIYGIFFPAALFLSIFSLIMGKKYVKEAGAPNAFSKIGKVVAIITLVLSCVFFLFGLLCTINPEFNAAFFQAMDGYLNGDLGLGGITDSSNGSSTF